MSGADTQVHVGIISPPEAGEEDQLDGLSKLDFLGLEDFLALAMLLSVNKIN